MEDVRRRRRTDREERRVRNVKTGGDILMYVGTAALLRPCIQRAKETNNGLLGGCATLAGAALAIGLGGIASNFLNKIIDKGMSFWDEVKPQDKDGTENG